MVNILIILFLLLALVACVGVGVFFAHIVLLPYLWQHFHLLPLVSHDTSILNRYYAVCLEGRLFIMGNEQNSLFQIAV